MNSMAKLFILGLILTTSGTLLLVSSKFYGNGVDFPLLDLALVFYGALMIAIAVALHGKDHMPHNTEARTGIR